MALRSILVKCAALVAMGLGALTPAMAAAGCTMVKVAEITVKMDGRTPLMAAVINGMPTYMLADTGATNSSLFGAALGKLSLTPTVLSGTQFFGVGGGVQAYAVRVDSLKLGGMEARNRDFLVLGQAGHGSDEVVGTLGDDFFAQADVEFDLAHKAIRFLRPKGCKDDEVLYWGGAYSMLPMIGGGDSDIAVQVMLNGHPEHAIMDTGATSTVVTLQAATSLGINVAAEDPKRAFTGIGKARVGYGVASFKTFAFDQEAVRDVNISVADLFKYNKAARLGSRLAEDVLDNPDMLLGADFFLAHRVMVSNSQQRVYVTYTGGPIFAVDKAEPEAPAK